MTCVQAEYQQYSWLELLSALLYYLHATLVNFQVAFLEDMKQLVTWCQANCLQNKIKEPVVDFEIKQQQIYNPHTPDLSNSYPSST